MAKSSKSAAAREAPSPAKSFPRAVRLTSMFVYLTDEGVRRAWAAGQEVIDPDEIAELQLQCAPIVEI